MNFADDLNLARREDLAVEVFMTSGQRFGLAGVLEVDAVRGSVLLATPEHFDDTTSRTRIGLGDVASVRLTDIKWGQATADSGELQAFLTGNELAAIEPEVARLRTAIEDAERETSPDEFADLMAQLQTIEAQLLSPRPRRSLVTATLEAIREVSYNAAGNLAAAGIAVAAAKILDIIL